MEKKTLNRFNKQAPTRNGYGDEIAEMGECCRDIVVLEADISKSTRTFKFSQRFPDRFINVGVAEQNEMATAAGLAACGAVPYVSTYSVFSSMRACEQLRTFVCYPNLNVKVAVSHGGITPGNDGVTHQATEDLGIVSTLPNISIIMPADYYSARKLVRKSYSCPGPVYLRFTRDPVPPVYSGDEDLDIGKAAVLKEGRDIALIGIGDMVYHCLQAAKKLEKLGISCSVVDMHTLKPLDEGMIYRMATNTRGIITAEDHQIRNGLGSAVCSVVCEKWPTRVRRIGLRDTFAESGEYSLLLKKYKMDVNTIINAAKKLLGLR
ncbi:MAG: transketolase family protein [Actinomycetota bacterium]